jgi:hypothetical protein
VAVEIGADGDEVARIEMWWTSGMAQWLCSRHGGRSMVDGVMVHGSLAERCRLLVEFEQTCQRQSRLYGKRGSRFRSKTWW